MHSLNKHIKGKADVYSYIKELTSIGLMQLHFDLPCFLFRSSILQSNGVSDRLFLLPFSMGSALIYRLQVVEMWIGTKDSNVSFELI